MFLQPQGKAYEQNPVRNCECPDDEGQAQGPGARKQNYADAKKHRKHTAGDQQPFTFHFLAQLDGTDDLKDTRRDRPTRDKQEQHKSSDLRPE